MKIRLYLVLLLVLWGLVGCSNKDDKDVYVNNYLFEGENDNWKAKFAYTEEIVFADLDAEKSSEGILTLTYKGKLSNLSMVEHIDIIYKADLFEGRFTGNYNSGITSKIFEIRTGGLMVTSNDVINVSIDLDGIEEDLELVIQHK